MKTRPISIDRADEQYSVRSQHAAAFGQELVGLAQVVDGLKEEQDVKTRIGKRKVVGVEPDEAGALLVILSRAPQVGMRIITPDNTARPFREVSQPLSGAAAHLQDILGGAIRSGGAITMPQARELFPGRPATRQFRDVAVVDRRRARRRGA